MADFVKQLNIRYFFSEKIWFTNTGQIDFYSNSDRTTRLDEMNNYIPGSSLTGQQGGAEYSFSSVDDKATFWYTTMPYVKRSKINRNGNSNKRAAKKKESSPSILETVKLAWDAKLIGKDIPDNISVDINLGSTAVGGASMTYSINFLTRGEAGVYLTRTEQERLGAEIDWGVNVNFGYYTGSPLDINKSTLLGPVKSVSGGYEVGGNVSLGYPNSDTNQPSWITGGTGFGLTYGVSYGWGQTYGSWNK